MSILEVLKYPDPILRKKAQAVAKLDGEHVELAQNMLQTMYRFKGIGLAAPQVGKLVKLIVVDTKWPYQDTEKYKFTELEKEIGSPIVLFNPQVTSKQGSTVMSEGCLSVPGYFEDVQRSAIIEVKGLDLQENEVVYKVDGLTAVCLQHEIDHLDGLTFIDRLSMVKSLRLRSKIKKFGYDEPETQPGVEASEVL